MTVAVTQYKVREESVMREKRVMKLASRGKRFGAACIDMVIPAVSFIISFNALIFMIAAEMAYGGYGYGFGDPGFSYGYGFGYNGPSAGVLTALIISILLGIAYIVIQLIFFNKSKTMGKAALGLQVVSSADGEPIGFWKMLFREWLVKGASGSVFLLGFIWILIDDKNRGWHDKILDTYVVDLKESAALHAGAASCAPKPVYRYEPAAPAEQPSVEELPDSVFDVADVVVNTAQRTAAETFEKPEYDTVNARTDDTDEQE